MPQTLIVILFSALCLLCFFVFRQHQHLTALIKLSKNNAADHHYFHLSQQLFQSSESLNQSLKQYSQHYQMIMNDAFQKVHKETQEQVSKQQLQTQGVFFDLMQRFTNLDEWQQQVQDLTHKVHQLAKVLDNSALKGKFGEMHLENIIKSIYPASWVSFQETLSNGTRVDCLISLGDKVPKIPIDSKFPLQTYKLVLNNPNNQDYLKDFVQVIKKNIADISEKYIIPGITTDYAIMFVPSEGLFNRMLELDDITHHAQQSRVLLASPQTLFWLLSVMKKFLLDSQLSQQFPQKLALLESIARHAVDLGDQAGLLERKSSALTKEVRSLKNELINLVELIEQTTQLSTNEAVIEDEIRE